jgi:RNA polymerase sigma-70 factor (ECF subfamily)
MTTAPPESAPLETETTRLMTAAKSGDDGAFDHLVQLLKGRAFHVATTMVGSHEDALELSQEAFLKVYRARETYRDGEPFLPWFHRILRNTCFSFLRKHRRLTRHSLDAPRDGEDASSWQIVDESAPAPLEGVEQDELRTLFDEALTKLSARDREILVLRHFQELSYKEIAEALDIPEGTVMSRLFHARRRLKERLAPYLSEPQAGVA